MTASSLFYHLHIFVAHRRRFVDFRRCLRPHLHRRLRPHRSSAVVSATAVLSMVFEGLLADDGR